MLSALGHPARADRDPVLCTPFRNPAMLAKMASTLDEVSGGRLILGLGAGWHQPEFDAFGVPFDDRVSRLEEALQIIGPLLRTGRVDFRGTYYSAPDCELIPLGPRPAGPPIMLAGKGPRMQHSWRAMPTHGTRPGIASRNTARARIESIRAACEAEGRDPATLEITASSPSRIQTWEVALPTPLIGPPSRSPKRWRAMPRWAWPTSWSSSALTVRQHWIASQTQCAFFGAAHGR